MSCLDLNSPNFNVLPPHFIYGLENQIISEAFNICFKNIINSVSENNIENFTGFLLRCLASIVYHSDKLKKVACSNPKHPFNSITILNNNEFLVELKKLVTIEKSLRLAMPTGIPPHVETLKKLDTIVKLLLEECTNREKWEEKFSAMLNDTINEVVFDASQITRPIMI